MTNNSQLYFVNVLLDYGATSSFMNYDFVHFKKINTQTILYSILVFNVNSFSNKAGQISKVIDIVLYYRT